MASSRILVGVFGAPHGVRGELRLKAYTADPLAVKAYSPLESEDGKRRFTLTSARLQGDMVVARVDGIADRDAAAALTNLKLYVPRERLPQAADEDEFYQADLIGLRVENASGEELGTITAVHDFGAGDVLEIKLPASGTAYLPFTKAIVPTVEVSAGRVIADPPADWLDEGTPEDADAP
ncbi:ribosome maturation factor RimM [Terrihabitans rhizophilus]|uniref:Ribosome maturation factor RimM n=1 Tax=Terrihabitans rhizophilus TaxID=3092662 RepID=A0ABU4RR23_9HYPH|nr:ribosome maturation factor RimM [Terrihabitans sp. PJ23]MDX6806085.1 ribosome maturation factor RimM [Terrihabitans sp. PJ23]